ncbi:unnamed protein product [Dracunculus medinensis]|uniref:Condensin complex subunit 1 n=1 Tax=Dracunculus medinensis TaxID=318479 RepID=A0A0N4UHT3_DRAME|nr:unnamed protein product [Dracunculus medinensis]
MLQMAAFTIINVSSTAVTARVRRLGDFFAVVIKFLMKRNYTQISCDNEEEKNDFPGIDFKSFESISAAISDAEKIVTGYEEMGDGELCCLTMLRFYNGFEWMMLLMGIAKEYNEHIPDRKGINNATIPPKIFDMLLKAFINCGAMKLNDDNWWKLMMIISQLLVRCCSQSKEFCAKFRSKSEYYNFRQICKLFDNRYSSTVQDRWYLIQLLKFIANEKNGAYAIAMAPGMSKRIIEQLEDENKFLYRAALKLVNSMVAKSFLAGKMSSEQQV